MRKDLHFYGPFTLVADGPDNLFKQENAELSGIYLWTFKGQDGYVIDYVGEASSIKERFIDHLRDQLNGRYSIYDPDKIRVGERVIQWKGYHWRKEERFRILDFIRNGEEHMRQLHHILKECRIFFAPIEATAEMRKRIESGILNQLLEMDFYTRSLQNPPQLRRGLKKEEIHMQIKVSTDETIIGLGELVLF